MRRRRRQEDTAAAAAAAKSWSLRSPVEEPPEQRASGRRGNFSETLRKN